MKVSISDYHIIYSDRPTIRHNRFTPTFVHVGDYQPMKQCCICECNCWSVDSDSERASVFWRVRIRLAVTHFFFFRHIFKSVQPSEDNRRTKEGQCVFLQALLMMSLRKGRIKVQYNDVHRSGYSMVQFNNKSFRLTQMFPVHLCYTSTF